VAVVDETRVPAPQLEVERDTRVDTVDITVPLAEACAVRNGAPFSARSVRQHGLAVLAENGFDQSRFGAANHSLLFTRLHVRVRVTKIAYDTWQSHRWGADQCCI